MRQTVIYRSLILAMSALIVVTPAWSRAKRHAKTTITLIGELHGTAEIPRMFENLVRVTARDDTPLAVGLELPVSLQPLLDQAVRDHLSSEELRERLSQSASWQRLLNIHDGRSSEAMLQLICDLTVLAEQSRVRFFVFDTEIAERNETMAAAISAKVDALKVSQLLILVGNYHASKAARIGHFDWHPMGWWLEQNGFPVRSFDVLYEEGEAWICTPECGTHHVGSRVAKPGAAPRQHIGYDDVIKMGHISPSLPATLPNAPVTP